VARRCRNRRDAAAWVAAQNQIFVNESHALDGLSVSEVEGGIVVQLLAHCKLEEEKPGNFVTTRKIVKAS